VSLASVNVLAPGSRGAVSSLNLRDLAGRNSCWWSVSWQVRLAFSPKRGMVYPSPPAVAGSVLGPWRIAIEELTGGQKDRCMRVLLQDAETSSFLRANRVWTPLADEALDFVQVVRAVDYALEHGLGDVRVVLKFRDARQDLKLPPVPSVA